MLDELVAVNFFRHPDAKYNIEDPHFDDRLREIEAEAKEDDWEDVA